MKTEILGALTMAVLIQALILYFVGVGVLLLLSGSRKENVASKGVGFVAAESIR
jgi:hypothetical protein